MANPKIQLRHDTSTNWQTQNPVLLEGEVAIETDSNKVKIGNGTDNYNALPYITDQTKIDLDYSNADYQPVNKAGDTMTGALSIALSGDDTKNLIIRNDSIERFVTPSTQNQTRIHFLDKNGDDIGSIFYQQRTDGSSRLNQILYGNSGSNAHSFIGLDSAGVPSCTFPNTTCCDGQWEYVNTKLMNAVSLNGTTNLTYTLTNIPADGHNYEVLLTGNCTVSATANNNTYLYISSDKIVSEIQLCRINTRTANSFFASGCAILPVSSSRKIYVIRANDNNGTANLWLKGYRRIGTNA